jgi:hypothetical protein
VAWLCRQLGVARSGFYAWRQRLQNPSPRALKNAVITAQVQTVFERHRGYYGAPRVHHVLKATGLKVGRHRVARLMRIVCTGLRTGEKLYEELLIDADSQPTSHPLIYRPQEQALEPDVSWPQIDALEAAIQRQDEAAALEVHAEVVPEWTRGD